MNSGSRSKVRALLLAVILGAFASRAGAADLAFTAGLFEPDDGVVREVFATSLEYSLEVYMPQAVDFDWTAGVTYQSLACRAFALEGDVAIFGLTGGFSKRFPREALDRGPEPFYGAGLSLDTVNEPGADPELTWGFYWEAGLLVPLPAPAGGRIIARLRDRTLHAGILGDVRLGGLTAAAGIRWEW